MTRQFTLGQTVKILVVASNDSFPTSLVVYKDGDVYTGLSITSSLVRIGLYQLSTIPSSTGFYEVAVESGIYRFEVVRKTDTSLLEDIYDCVIGSWQWNKITGLLEMFRTSGTKLASYNIKDNSDEASREKLS